MKTPVSRVGNKTPILNILYAVFPNEYNRFIDVFGGSGSVFLLETEQRYRTKGGKSSLLYKLRLK